MSNEAKPSNAGRISEMVQGWSDGLQQDKPRKKISQKEKMLLDVAAFLDELIVKMEEGETDTAKEMLKRQIQEYDEQRKKSAAKQTKAYSEPTPDEKAGVQTGRDHHLFDKRGKGFGSARRSQ